MNHEKDVPSVEKPCFMGTIHLAEESLCAIPRHAAFQAALQANADAAARELIAQNPDGEKTSLRPRPCLTNGAELFCLPKPFTRSKGRVD